MVQDLWIINEAVVPLHPTVPNPYVILGEIPPSAKWFTVLDLKDAFFCISSVQFSPSVLSDSKWPHELQHARPPCPSPTPGAYSNSCPLSWWCHPAISSSVIPFSSHSQYLPASGSFPISQLFAWGGQSIGVWALASVLLMNTQDWSPLFKPGLSLLFIYLFFNFILFLNFT